MKEIVRLLTNIDNNTKEKEKPVESGPVTRSMVSGGTGLVNAENVSSGVEAGRMLSQWFKRVLDDWARERVGNMAVSEANKVIQQER